MSNSIDQFVQTFGYGGMKQLFNLLEGSQLWTGLYYSVFLTHTLGQQNFTQAKVKLTSHTVNQGGGVVVGGGGVM